MDTREVDLDSARMRLDELGICPSVAKKERWSRA
jgi:hypothetical protein